jgi:hypothetical protein
MPPFNQTPDAPQSFGYKTLWFSIKASDPVLVVDALEFGQATPANWASGLAAACSDSGSETSGSWVFVSPPIHGWVLVTSDGFPYPVTIDAHHDIGRKFDVLFSRLMKRFGDVQFFGSHRVVGFVTWARACGGEPTRIFGFADGDVLANVGEQTAEEAQLGFVNLSGMSPPDACEKIFAAAEEEDLEETRLIASGISPRDALGSVRENNRDPIPDEDDVVDLAGLWSIDPAQLSDQDHPSGLGFAVRLPNNLAQ